jgi:hypothetical protein
VQGLQKPVCNLRPKKSGRCGPILWHGFARWVFDGTKRQEILLSTCARASPALPNLPTYTQQPQELDLRETGTINAGGVYAKRRMKLGTKAVIIPKCVLFPSLRDLRFCQTHLCHMLRRALYEVTLFLQERLYHMAYLFPVACVSSGTTFSCWCRKGSRQKY